METTQVETQHGLWTILRRGESICIVDHLGRMRHQSRGHTKTAQFYAGALADLPFASSDLLDRNLRHTAEHFASGGFDGPAADGPSEHDKMAADAARYRWLRDRNVGVLVREGIEPTWYGWLGVEALDEEIDRRRT